MLLQREDNPGDRELLDALFRCAHTVKGSAGIFSLDRVVAFTHHVETLLDDVREGRVALTPELSTLLLQSNDQIRTLVSNARAPDAESDDTLQARAALVQRLHAASGPVSGPAAGAGTGAATAAGAGLVAPPGAERRWFVSARFGADTFRNGMDPPAILNYVRRPGTVRSLVCDSSAVPTLHHIDPETCHLGFEFLPGHLGCAQRDRGRLQLHA